LSLVFEVVKLFSIFPIISFKNRYLCVIQRVVFTAKVYYLPGDKMAKYMAKYKRYDYKQSLMIPVSLEEQLVPGTLEFAIHTLVERRMDMSVFDANYQNDDVGRSAYDPKILLKVVLLGYSRGLTSSRQIQRACCENVLFMALSCNQRPDHSTIAAFVVR